MDNLTVIREQAPALNTKSIEEMPPALRGFWSELGESFQGLTVAVVDTGGNLVTAYGDQATAQAAQSAAIAEYNSNVGQLAVMQAQAAEEQKKRNQNLIIGAMIVVGVIVLAFLSFKKKK